MPNGDVLPNSAIARTPEACPPGPAPAPAYVYPWGPPPPPYPYPEPPCPPPSPSSIEAQIAKLAKKSAIIRKMIENLTTKNKSIIMSIGGAQYNFGAYLDAEQDVTTYGNDVLTNILEVELEAIKAKLIELTNDLEVAEVDNGIEGNVGG